MPHRTLVKRLGPALVPTRRALIGAALGGISAASLAQGFPGGVREALGPRFNKGKNNRRIRDVSERQLTADRLRDWHGVALDATGLDHTPVADGETRVFGEQLGPCRSSRAMALVHVGMFEVINAVRPGYRSSIGLTPASPGVSINAAVAQVAHDLLAALFPSQAAAFASLLARDLSNVRADDKAAGVQLGQRVAAILLARAASDGSQHAEAVIGVDFTPGTLAGQWRPDPVSQIPIALGLKWGQVRPMVIASGQQFRLPPPPSLASAEYAAAFDEVKALGGDGVVTPTTRSSEQTQIGIYWAYDGTPSLCAPPRLYNQLAIKVAQVRGTTDMLELARLLALVNVAMCDTAIAAWDSKWHYQTWRPVTGIREADAGSGPSGAGDNNPRTVGDASFLPLGAPASNLSGPNFTPPFPAYPSGHAAFGGALFQTLRNVYGTDRIAFSFVSDEMNGETYDNQGNIRPRVERTFAQLSDAEEENGQSRMYLGIHWAFDKTQGIVQGRRVADHIHRNAFQRLVRDTRGDTRGAATAPTARVDEASPTR